MDLIHTVLSSAEFERRPPVLVDVGSSGGLHSAWKILAPYSICLAFDPDGREMAFTSKAAKDYRELHVFDAALTTTATGPAEVYLTKAPACSSLLQPNHEKLAAYEFAVRFTVIGKAAVKTIDLETALGELKLDRVDWFKTDSQGTDLRLLASLGPTRLNRVVVAELEPGII